MTDWDAAYDNRAAVPDAGDYIAKWTQHAAAFRADAVASGTAELDIEYGDAAREKIDLFHPNGTSKGLVVFVHGGYWKAFDKSFWSHLAKGVLAHGWSVAIPSYSLAPEVRISHMTKQVAAAIEHLAGITDGPIRLAGHSAGGHLVSRMGCEDSSLSAATLARIVHITSISGVHDLRQLLRLKMNEEFQLDEAEAQAESPCLIEPHDHLIANCPVTCWVGGNELPEFIRQNDLLADAWGIAGVQVKNYAAPNHHHFSVIEDLEDAESALTRDVVCAV